MIDKIKAMKSGTKKVAGGGAGAVAILGLIWTIFINPINADVKDNRSDIRTNREKGIERDGRIKMNATILKRIDDNVKILLAK